MTVREATLDDIPAIARVQVDTWRTTYRGIVPDSFLDGLTYESRERQWTAALGAGSRTRLVVGEDDAGRVVGFAASGPELGGDPDYKGELYAIYIDAGAQGRGLGRRLVRAVARRLADEGMTSLLLWVLAGNPSRGFYERLGGREVRAKPIAIGGATLEEVAYGWADTGVLLREHGDPTGTATTRQ